MEEERLIEQEEQEEELENNKEEELDFTISLSQDSVIKMLKRMAIFNNFKITSIEIEPIHNLVEDED